MPELVAMAWPVTDEGGELVLELADARALRQLPEAIASQTRCFSSSPICGRAIGITMRLPPAVSRAGGALSSVVRAPQRYAERSAPSP